MRITKDFLMKENAELKQKLKFTEENYEYTRRALANTLGFNEVKNAGTYLEKREPVTWIDIGFAVGKLKGEVDTARMFEEDRAIREKYEMAIRQSDSYEKELERIRRGNS